MTISVINGPNLNMLGIREPELYGNKTYAELVSYIKEKSASLGAEVMIFQSNSEGKIVDRIQNAYGTADAIVINAAGYSHTSIAVLDALKATGLPAAEVHLTDIASREDFRRFSYTSLGCLKTFSGKGFQSYGEALAFICDHVRNNHEKNV